MSSSVMTLFNDGLATARIVGRLPRGWAISAGDQSTLPVPKSLHVPELGIGTIIYCGHDRLPDWAGFVDTPWNAKAPAQATVYDIAYLLSRRCPDAQREYTGTTAQILEHLLEEFEDQGEVGFRLGDTEIDPAYNIALDQRSYWDLIGDLVKNAGLEMRVRPVISVTGKLDLLVDVKRQLGYETGYRLHDGEGGNMVVTAANIASEVWTCIYAIGDQSSKASRLAVVLENRIAAQRYEPRSKTVQFSGIKDQTALEQAAMAWLAANSGAYLTLTVSAFENDVHGDTFAYLDLGNRLMVQAGRVHLPNGRRGWRGLMRIMAMQYDAKRKVNMTLTSEEPV